MSNVDREVQHQIAKALPIVAGARKTFWEDLVRIAWALVVGYAVLVVVFMLIAANAKPK